MRPNIILLFLIVIIFVIIVGRGASAEFIDWPEWSDEIALDFGRCLMAEDSSGLDWSALGWSLIKQWRFVNLRRVRTFHQQIRWYCAIFEKTGSSWKDSRPYLINKSTWEDPRDDTPVRKWNELREFVAKFRDRLIADPCPLCIWWGGPRIDLIPSTWTCPLVPPITHNAFCYYRTELSGR